MSNLRQAAQQAVEAMDKATRFMSDSDYKKLNQAIDDLRAALAEPEQEVWCDCGDSIEPDSGAKCGNCVAGDSAEPEQNRMAVAWMEAPYGVIRANPLYRIKAPLTVSWSIPLYTAPTPRKPLSEGEIYAAIQGIDSLRAVEVARAIERAHGITGENK